MGSSQFVIFLSIGKNIKVDKITKETVHLILDYALSNDGSILQIRDTICNKISYASICLSENHTANLIISLVANDYRKQDLAVLGIHKTINFWKERGIDNFDFNGSKIEKHWEKNTNCSFNARNCSFRRIHGLSSW